MGKATTQQVAEVAKKRDADNAKEVMTLEVLAQTRAWHAYWNRLLQTVRSPPPRSLA
jgi:hypothetical protein